MGARKFHFDESPTGRRCADPRQQTLPPRCKPLYTPVQRHLGEVDFVEAELRALAWAIQRREARNGSEDYMDPFDDFLPVDFT